MSDPRRTPPDEDPKPTSASQESTRASDPSVGDSHRPEGPAPPGRLGDFEVLREIGRGGMGVVYEARQISLRRNVALKVLPPALGMSRHTAQRFEREAHAAAKLHHTNIVPVHAIGEEAGSHFYAMELVDGEPLDRILTDLAEARANPLMEATVTRAAERTPAGPAASRSETSSASISDSSAGGRKWFDAVARLIEEVASALDYAHGRGIVHRDIKPANLLLSRDGRLMITDFGLARILEEPGMTVSGSFMGTPAYMSPEQIAAGRMKIDHRTDVYSLGAVLYEMLTLRRPFPGDSREEVVAGIMTKDPRPPRRFNHRIPLDLETICLKALEKDPDRRYQSAGEMAQDLHRHLHGGLIAARRAGLLRRSWKSIRRHPVATVALAGAVMIATVGGLAWWAWEKRIEQEIHSNLADARFSHSRGEFREALRKADLVLDAAPDLPEARLIRSQCLFSLIRGKEVLEEALARLERDPGDWVSHLMVATAAKTGVFYAGEIEPHIRAVEELAPETAEAYTVRSRASDSAVEAIALLDRALEIDPGYDYALSARAYRHLELKNFRAVSADADRLIAAQPRSIWGRVLKVEYYLGLHHGEAALEEIERAIRLDPEEPSAYLVRGIIYRLFFADHEKALADFSRAIEIEPENSVFHNQRAWTHLNMGKLDAAVADAGRARELNPEGPGLLAVPIDVGIRRQDRAEVERLLDEADRFFEKMSRPEALSEYYENRAHIFLRLEDYPRALAEANDAVEADPERWQAYVTRARLKSIHGDAEGAEADCDRAGAIELDEPEELLNRGYYLSWGCDRKEEAIRDFSRSIGAAPKWADPLLGRAQQYVRLGQFDKALPDLDGCVELADRWTACYRSRSVNKTKLGLYAEALEDNDMMLRITPDDYEAHQVRSWILNYLHRPEEALAAIGRAIELAPSLADPYSVRAYILASRGVSCTRVEEDMQKALELDRSNWAATSVLAYVHVLGLFYNCPDLYDLDTALKMASTSVEQWPDFDVARRALGAALYRSGRFEEAIAHQTKALAMYGGEATDLFLLAMEHWQLGHRAEARAHYDRAVAWMEEHNPDYPTFVNLREEASEMLGIQP